VKNTLQRDWSQHALLVIDIQNDFFKHVSDPEEFELSIVLLLRDFRKKGIDIIHVRSLFNDDGSDWMLFARIAGNTPCVEGSDGVGVPSWAREQEVEPVFVKKHFDAFLTPGLSDYLRENGYRHLFFCGLDTSICVNLSALTSMQRGFATTVLSDCCRDDPELHHHTLGHYGSFAYNVMKHGDIDEQINTISRQIRIVDEW
jgi:nicotinamidase-related amidase